MLKLKLRLTAIFIIFFAGCVGIPDNVDAINDFELERYLGRWYEIARLDHSFERGLSNVTAEYSMREDGGVKVINRGFNDEEKEWDEAEGKAFFVETPDVGRLKVSFFGPFYGGYNIIELDKENYSYSMVCGPDTDYLWILSRTPKMDETILLELVNYASKLRFNTSELIFVDQSMNE